MYLGGQFLPGRCGRAERPEKVFGPSNPVSDLPITHKSGLRPKFQNGKTGIKTMILELTESMFVLCKSCFTDKLQKLEDALRDTGETGEHRGHWGDRETADQADWTKSLKS